MAVRQRIGLLISGLATLVLLGIAAVGILSRTDWGHERVRRQLVSIIGGKTHGTVKMGKITGNLLRGATVDSLEIIDSLGVPFLRVERVSARYKLMSFYRHRLEFDDVTLIRPVLLFDRPPEMKWNISRLWPSTRKPGDPEDPAINWGDVFDLTNVKVVDGSIIVRAAWHPNDTLSRAQQDSALRFAMGPRGRFVIVEAPGGYQRVSRFDHINGTFPQIRLADPEQKWMLVRVATANMLAQPFRGPVAKVLDMKGLFEFEDDSAWFDNVAVRLPASRLVAGGRYYPNDDNLVVRMRARPGAFADFKWAYPDFPDTGGGPIDFAMTWWDGVDTYELKNFDLAVGRSQVAGNSTIKVFNGPDTVLFTDTDIRFRNFDTRLISRVPPGLEFPRVGTMTGRASVEGTMANLRVDADIAYTDAVAGSSHVIAKGDVGIRGGLRTRGLRVSMEPLQVALIRQYVPDLPIGGTLRGNVVLDGSEASGIVARGGIVHNDRTGRSALTGRASIQLAGARRIDANARLHPVSLATAGRFAPDLGLRGAATGRLALKGTMRNMTVDTDLAIAGGGHVAARGTLNLGSSTPGYDLRTVLRDFNANAVIARAPRTSLTGNVYARGRGTDPATMNAVFAGRLDAIRFDTLTADSARFHVAIADGLLRVDTLIADGPAIRAVAQGTLGMREGRSGELRYDVTIDSLQYFTPLVPKAVDTTVVAVRPRTRALRLERARADSARVARATEVERAATGRRGPGPIRVAAAPSIRSDSVTGWVRARGVLRGNIKRLSTDGAVEMRDVLLRGYSAKHGIVDYKVTDLRTATARIDATARLDSVIARGFELDSVRAKVTYAEPNGTAEIVLHQTTGETYAANGSFVLHTEHNEVHLMNLRLQFDTTRWVAARPSTIRWGKAGVEVQTFELRSGWGGRLYVNGLLPTEGNASFDIKATRFQVGDIAALLQSDLAVRGVIDVDAHVEGTIRDPRIRGTLAVNEGNYRGTAFPDVRGTFGYALGVLTGRAEALREGGAPLMVASGRLPINLGWGRDGPLFPDGSEMDVAINADSLPIDLIPSFSGVIADVRGAARGDIRVRGSFRSPRIEGAVTLTGGSATIVPTGMKLAAITARFRLSGDSLVVDTLSATAGRGWIAVKGGVEFETLAQPGFDLTLVANNARVLDNDRGRLSADANITAKGPFKAVIVSGTANIRNGVLYIPEASNAEVLKRNDPAIFAVVDTSVQRDVELIAGESPLFEHLVVDIALTVQRDTWVRSKEANIEVHGDLLVKMDRHKDALALDGSINTDRGEYSLFSKRFQVRSGTATFLPMPTHGLNPLLQITAEYEVKEPTREAIIVKLVIGGTLENPNLALESNAQPPIPQGDLLSYLAFGRSSGTLLQIGGSALAGASASGGLGGSPLMSAAGQALTGMAIGLLADEVEGQASRALRVDMFNIEPAPNFLTELRTPRNLLEKTEIEFGKYINPRTFVSVRTLLSFTGEDKPPPPGIRFQTRARRGIRYEAGFEPRYGVAEPSLERGIPGPYGVFGSYIIREWRF